jgi:SAM-dependent methyltransferase
MAALTPDHILQTGFGFWASRTLLAACELELFTELAKKSGELADVSQRLKLHPRSARDFLDALVALKFLQRENGVYRNSPETDLFLDKNKPTYMGGMLEMCSQRLFGFWNHLPEALRTGKAQNEGKSGGDFFGALYADPKRLREFLNAMSGLSRGANMRIAELVPWAKYKTFVDVGTAQGDTAVQIAKKHSHLSGIGFDLAKAQPIFEEYVKANGLSDRVKFKAGDFFKDELPKADVITMGHILHDWNLDEKRVLIKKAYDALPAGGSLVVYEAIIDDERKENAFGLLMSINMLIETPGGFDYTAADGCGWMKDAGFKETRVEHLVGPDSMVVGVK